MKGDALSWFKWMYQNHQLFNWPSFTKALELRFRPSTYANHQAELFKLRQHGSVSEYQALFEKLGNCVIGLSAEALLNFFISGLSTEIRNEMAIHRPQTITQAIGLAKLIEAKLKDSRNRPQRMISQPFSPNYTRPRPTISNTTLTPTPPQPTSTPSTTPPKPNSIPPTKLHVKCLNQAQVQERRALGICYNCDEKFIPGHKCSTGRFLLLLVDDESETVEPSMDTDPPEDNPPHDQSNNYFQISPQAVSGQFSPQTLKFQGFIRGQPIMVLLDTGSTHNILQPRIASHLNLPIDNGPQFSVMVGNGSYLECQGTCRNVPITLQKANFDLPFYLILIQGVDVVLGMAWLRTLGPIQADFSIPSITFQHHNEVITLIGDPKSPPTQSTYNQLCHLIHTDSIASFHLLTFQPNPQTEPNEPPSHTKTDTDITSHPAVNALLSSYPTVFNTPHGFPPSRVYDYHIPLLPNTTPVNVKPYSYPHSQKETMTSLIQDMLRDGTIIPSTSPFSSPVLLV